MTGRAEYCATMAKDDYPCRDTLPSHSCVGCEFERPCLDPNNYDIWYLWGKVRTQWRVVAGATRLLYLGLDYAAVYLLANTMCIDMTPANLAKLSALEDKTISAMNTK